MNTMSPMIGIIKRQYIKPPATSDQIYDRQARMFVLHVARIRTQQFGEIRNMKNGCCSPSACRSTMREI